MRIRKNDMVVLNKAITGAAHPDGRPVGQENKGAVARVLKVMPSRDKAIVEGVNLVYKHVRPSQNNPRGGRVAKEAAVPLANLSLYCQKCNGPSRVGKKIIRKEDAAGKMRRQTLRICKRCGESIGAE